MAARTCNFRDSFGGVVELGQVVGVPTPLNRALSDILALHANGKPKA